MNEWVTGWVGWEHCEVEVWRSWSLMTTIPRLLRGARRPEELIASRPCVAGKLLPTFSCCVSFSACLPVRIHFLVLQVAPKRRLNGSPRLAEWISAPRREAQEAPLKSGSARAGDRLGLTLAEPRATSEALLLASKLFQRTLRASDVIFHAFLRLQSLLRR